MTSAIWTQQAGELDVVRGQITYTGPAACTSTPGGFTMPGSLAITLRVDGRTFATMALPSSPQPQTLLIRGEEGLLGGLVDDGILFEPDTATQHAWSATARANCPDQPGAEFTITKLALDVIGFR